LTHELSLHGSPMGRILVVDDDQSVVFMLAEVLRDAGHEVLTSLSAEGTLALVADVDAALVDLCMPGVGGVTLTRRIRELKASLPVILLTADASAKVSDDATAAGAFGVMTKPVDIDDLSAAIERALLSARPAEDAGRA